MKNNYLRKNLLHLMAVRRHNPTSLAHATGVVQSTIHRICQGDVKDPHGATIQPIADYFGVSVGDLKGIDLTGIGEIRRQIAFKMVPVRGRYMGGVDGRLEEFKKDDGFVAYPSEDGDAYAIGIRGDAFRPRIRSGEFVVAEPGTKPEPGDHVVVGLTSGAMLIRELLYTNHGETVFGCLNTGEKLSLPVEEIAYVHAIAAIVPARAFKSA